MPNSNVGKRVIRAGGRDGYTCVTYRLPERATWLCGEDRKMCNLGRNKHPGMQERTGIRPHPEKVCLSSPGLGM